MSEDTLKDISMTLKQILKWTRFAGMRQLRDVLNQTLKTETELMVFELSDGTRGTREVAAASRTSHTTVGLYWKKWSKVGIVEPSSTYQGRFQRICSLEEVGLAAPTPQQVAETTSSGDAVEVKQNE